MHRRTRELLDHLARARADLTSAVARVPADARQVKPEPDRWSVAEMLEHLAIVEARIAAMVAKDVAAARETGLGRETSESSVLATVDVDGLADRRHKRVAGDASLPTGTLTADGAWERLEASRRNLEDALRDADGWALETLTQAHPRLGAMNLYQWIAFVGAHETRHAAQIAEVASHLARA